jgi:hypothetical protein
MRTLDLIQELWDASEPADRCPHLQHAASGYSCSVAADPDTSRMVCDPFVRREKASIFSGCNSHPANVVPAGSNRSGSGGNNTAEAFDAKGRLGRLREQSGRNVSERRAGLERRNVGADPAKGWGRPPSQVSSGERHDSLLWSHRGNGDGMSAQGDRTQHGKPQRWETSPNRTPARDRPGRVGWRTGS